MLLIGFDPRNDHKVFNLDASIKFIFKSLPEKLVYESTSDKIISQFHLHMANI